MLQRLSERFAPQPRKRIVRLDAKVMGNAATVRLGDSSFDLSSDFEDALTHDNFDFALFGAAAIAIRNNWDIETDLPMTAEAVRAVRSAVDTLDMWRARRCYPIRFDCKTIVEPAATRLPDGIICLSGGVDSTWAAIEKARLGEISHGVLIAGADYPSRAHPGFVDLLSRVRSISSRIGIKPVTAETTIRKFKLYWPISHVFILAMVLAFHASRFRRGYIAADFTLAQEFGYHPWGNSKPMVDALGGTGFPIRQAGETLGRTAKLARIVGEDAALMKSISVCYAHKASGENCGSCEKCIRTKLNLAASGIPHADYFIANFALHDQLRSLPLPETEAGLRRHMVFLKDTEATMPEGVLRVALQERLAVLRKRTTPLGKV